MLSMEFQRCKLKCFLVDDHDTIYWDALSSKLPAFHEVVRSSFVFDAQLLLYSVVLVTRVQRFAPEPHPGP
jgi:hypothetical protein